MAAKKIRVHNQGKRDYTLPPAKKGGKNRLLPAGRAIEIEEKLALKMIGNYPRDLVEFDSLVSGERKDLNKENSRLESENSSHLEKIEKLETENSSHLEKIEKLETDVDPEIQKLKDKISALEKDLEASTQPVEKSPAEPTKAKKE